MERYGILIVFLLLMLDIPQKILDPAITYVSKELVEKLGGLEIQKKIKIRLLFYLYLKKPHRKADLKNQIEAYLDLR